MNLMSGSLVEDPRNIQSETLSGLFGLRLSSINDNDDEEEDKPQIRKLNIAEYGLFKEDTGDEKTM